MNRVEPLRVRLGQAHQPHALDPEVRFFDTLEYGAGELTLNGIRFDNG